MRNAPRFQKESDHRQSVDFMCNSDEFRMYCFKVLPCSKHYSHDWTICPFAHPGEKARRRDPRVFNYTAVECPHVKEGVKCPRGDLCPFGHSIFECWLHPTKYRTQLCNESASCKRKVCFFAHALEELREPSDPTPAPTEGGGIGSGTGSRMSLDELRSIEALNGLLFGAPMPQRQSIDVASLNQMKTHLEPVISASKMNDLLISDLQILKLKEQVQQNQQFANSYVAGLINEITQTQQQQNLRFGNRFSLDLVTPQFLQDPALSRWSHDGLPGTNPQQISPQIPIQANYQLPAVVGGGLVPSVFNPDPSLTRVSIDNSALLQNPNPASRGVQSRLSLAGNPQNQNFQSILEIPARFSDDRSSSVPSSSEFSADFLKAENFPVSYPLDGETYPSDPNLDSTLPEPFILF